MAFQNVNIPPTKATFGHSLEVHHFYSNAYNKICRTVLLSILNSRCLLWSGVRSPVWVSPLCVADNIKYYYKGPNGLCKSRSPFASFFSLTSLLQACMDIRILLLLHIFLVKVPYCVFVTESTPNFPARNLSKNWKTSARGNPKGGKPDIYFGFKTRRRRLGLQKSKITH